MSPGSVTSPVSSPDELLTDLNPPQREAVLAPEGPLLVLAGAGSGKTRVITRRVAHLVLARRVEAWRILAVTFTNKAAREMRERLFGLLGPWAVDLTVSTFHASAAAILRREAEKVGLTRSFVIYDDADQLSLVKRAMREERIDPVINPREVLHRIDMEKNAGRLPAVEAVDPSDYRGAAVQRSYRAYQRLLRAANAVDFGDLLLLLVQLFRENEATRSHYAAAFPARAGGRVPGHQRGAVELLHQLAPPPTANLVVVGDDDQSIYRWRGADVGNILRFPEEYTGATSRQAGAELPQRPDTFSMPPTRSSRRIRTACRSASGPSGSGASRWRCSLAATSARSPTRLRAASTPWSARAPAATPTWLSSTG